MKLATTTDDFKAYSSTPAQAIRLFEGTGFKVLDLNLYTVNFPKSPWVAKGGKWKRITEEAGQAAAELGMSFNQAHAPDGEHFTPGEARDNLLLATRRSIEACAMLGIKNIVVHPAGNPSFTPTQFMIKNREFYTELYPHMEKYNVNVLIENGAERNSPHYYLRTGAEMREFLDFLGHPLMHACWDTGHANMRGMDQYSSIVTLGSELYGMHIADNFGEVDSHIVPFFGTGNFDQVLQGLKDIGYAGEFTFESTKTPHNHGDWPHYRAKWQYKGKEVTKLLDVPLHIKHKAVALMYEIGKHMLEQYGCFEE